MQIKTVGETVRRRGMRLVLNARINYFGSHRKRVRMVRGVGTSGGGGAEGEGEADAREIRANKMIGIGGIIMRSCRYALAMLTLTQTVNNERQSPPQWT